jgi:hypothetical protein
MLRTTMLALSMALGLAAAAVAAAPERDSATIVNSGSTNMMGFAIQVFSDGTGTAGAADRSGTPLASPKPFALQAGVAATFFTDLATARQDRAAVQPCMKSASFGSTTRVIWHDWTSPDLSCPPAGSASAALLHDVETITAAAGVAQSPRHRFNMPEPSPTAS